MKDKEFHLSTLFNSKKDSLVMTYLVSSLISIIDLRSTLKMLAKRPNATLISQYSPKERAKSKE